ncbi:TPA: hypothetical protein DIS61_00030 [Patescibacteria group bacterium]|nr:hypothetical protein [Patescibacteria group bacterium]
MTRKIQLAIFGLLTFSFVFFVSGGLIGLISKNTQIAQAQTGLVGDANGDGHVDEGDYNIWLINYNLPTSLGSGSGDFNNDRIVDGVDYTLWLAHYGEILVPTPSPSIVPIPSASPIITKSRPFGPFNPPTSDFGFPYTGGFLDLNINTALATLASAKASSMHVFVHLTGGRSNFQTSTGAFDLTKWKTQLDNWKSLVPQIQGFVDDGTIIGHMMLDEPQDPNNWDGNTVPCSDILGAADYSHSAAFWPNMPAGAGTHATWIADQSCDWLSSKFDFTLTPYTYARGVTYQNFLTDNIAAANRTGVTFYASLNVLDGGTTKGVEMTQQQIQDAGGYFLCNGANGLTMWKWDSTFFTRTDIQAAMDYLNARITDPDTNCQ